MIELDLLTTHADPLGVPFACFRSIQMKRK